MDESMRGGLDLALVPEHEETRIFTPAPIITRRVKPSAFDDFFKEKAEEKEKVAKVEEEEKISPSLEEELARYEKEKMKPVDLELDLDLGERIGVAFDAYDEEVVKLPSVEVELETALFTDLEKERADEGSLRAAQVLASGQQQAEQESDYEKQAMRVVEESRKVENLGQYFKYVEWIGEYLKECDWDLGLSLHLISLNIGVEDKVLREEGFSLRNTKEKAERFSDSSPVELEAEDFMSTILSIQKSHQEELIEQGMEPGLFNSLDECLIDMMVGLVGD